MTKTPSFLVVIPSRFQSERLPGKPLIPILGISLILRVCNQLKDLPHKVVVATDSTEIYHHVTESGFDAVMTSPNHNNGTSRCIECAEILLNKGFEFDVLINVQGDEPLINPLQLDEISEPFMRYPEMNIATLCRQIEKQAEIENPNIVKVVKGTHPSGFPMALYFSRLPVPYKRDLSKSIKATYYKHVGIYAFRTHFLEKLKSMPAGSLEQIEKLEQLRWLENGHSIGVFETNFENIGVDTPEDIASVENFLKNTQN